MVMMFTFGLVDLVERAVEGGGLPRAGGPGDQHRAEGAPEAGLEQLRATTATCPADRARSGPGSCPGSASPSPRRPPAAWSPRAGRSTCPRRSGTRGRPAGSRRSAMSRSAMIFMRETVPATIRRGMCVLSRSTPSTRKRTRMSRSSGSKWMSEAPSSTACAITEFTSLITGASSADSRISVTSASSSSPCSTAAATASSSRLMRPISSRMSSCEPTTGSTSWPVISFRSSSASTFDGSCMATSRWPASSKPIGAEPSRRAAWAPIRFRAPTSALKTRQVHVREAEALRRGARQLVGRDRLGLEQQHLRSAPGGLRPPPPPRPRARAGGSPSPRSRRR